MKLNELLAIHISRWPGPKFVARQTGCGSIVWFDGTVEPSSVGWKATEGHEAFRVNGTRLELSDDWQTAGVSYRMWVLSRRTTSQAHAETLGARCPVCRSGDVRGGEVSTGGGVAAQEMSCGSCEEVWYDQYRLTGYQHTVGEEQ